MTKNTKNPTTAQAKTTLPGTSKSENRSRREMALAMAARGINIFIIDPGSKRPLAGKSWYISQSTDETHINEWFDYYEDYNYGVHLGNDYVVLDLDVKPHENGVQEFEKLCADHDIKDFLTELNTLTVKTPGGGYHLYFRTPFPCANRNNFPPGIDVRGQIGYVVGPGSHYDGLAEGKYKGDYETSTPTPKFRCCRTGWRSTSSRPARRTPTATSQ